MCNILSPVDETWGRPPFFTGLTFQARPTDNPATPTIDERETLSETLVNGVTLVAGFARIGGAGVDTTSVAIAIKNGTGAPARFEAPGINQYQQLTAAVFQRGSARLVLIQQELIDGQPTSPFRRRVSFRILPVAGGPVVVPDSEADFDLQGPDIRAAITVAPSPSGLFIFMWRGSAPIVGVPGSTLEHVLWRTDTGRTITRWGGNESSGSTDPFRVCRITAASRLVEFRTSSDIDSASPGGRGFHQAQLPAADLRFTPLTLTITASGPQGSPPTPATGSIRLQNMGNDAAQVTGLTLPAPFALVMPPALPLCLEPGEERALTVRFAPSTHDPANATITATMAGRAVTADLRGRVTTTSAPGPTPTPSFRAEPAAPRALRFPPEVVTTLPITVTNTGNVPIDVRVPRGGQYGIDWTELPWTPLAPNAALTHPVTHYATEGDVVSATVRVEARSAAGLMAPQFVSAIANLRGINPGDLAILQLEANPEGDDVAGEFISLINTTTADLDLAGVSIEHRVFPARGAPFFEELYRFQGPTILPPFRFTLPLPVAVVRTGSGTDTALVRHAGRGRPVWNNNGDTARVWGVLPDGSRGLITTATYQPNQFIFAGTTQPYTPPRVVPVVDSVITVPESAGWIDTGIDLEDDDRVDFFGSGSIWAGVWFTGENGPEGWVDWVQTGQNWPYRNAPDAFSFCLIGRIGPEGASVFRIGTRLTRVIAANAPQRLFLRINDDVPGNGSGAFSCRVVVRR